MSDQEFQHHTRHDANALRYLLTGPHGTLELRITTTYAAVICPDGEAECMPGAEIVTLWQAADQDEAVIWAELERQYDGFTVPSPPPPLLQGPQYEALRRARDWCDFVTEHGDQDDIRAAEDQHGALIRQLPGFTREP